MENDAKPITAAQIKALITRNFFRYSDEIALQNGLQLLFEGHGLPTRREVSLSPRDRIDFMVGDIGIEVKVASTTAQVERQLWRYAESSQVAQLVLVTTRSRHKLIPPVIKGKPLEIAHLSGI